ncbi:PAS domain-containing protein [Maribellus mangrovi]|uniref:PAS domain-containing protein n=1 Tax=Maribellus mangrovi TaxID=3133146 RepID=UPI0030EC9B6C
MDHKNKKEHSALLEDLRNQVSEMKIQLEDSSALYQSELERRQYYQLIADFTFAWELWFEPNGSIKYCSPSCYDITGYTSNEIIHASGIDVLLVYEADKISFNTFLKQSLGQSQINQTLEFRILTRTKQLRWCMMNVRGVYDKLGKYLGIRASVQDITRLKRAMGHISDLEKGKEFEQRNKQHLQHQLELKDRELVSFLLLLSQKNELIQKTNNLIEQYKKADSKKQKQIISQLSEAFGQHDSVTIDWSMIENQVEKIHPGFLDRLQKKHPVITAKDKKLCSYIRLGLSSKDIAGLMNITSKSVEISRVRIRKKLHLDSGVRLASYLFQL